jgi:hypothetical protein
MLLEDVVRQVLSAATPSLRRRGKKRHRTRPSCRSPGLVPRGSAAAGDGASAAGSLAPFGLCNGRSTIVLEATMSIRPVGVGAVVARTAAMPGDDPANYPLAGIRAGLASSNPRRWSSDGLPGPSSKTTKKPAM